MTIYNYEIPVHIPQQVWDSGLMADEAIRTALSAFLLPVSRLHELTFAQEQTAASELEEARAMSSKVTLCHYYDISHGFHRFALESAGNLNAHFTRGFIVLEMRPCSTGFELCQIHYAGGIGATHEERRLTDVWN